MQINVTKPYFRPIEVGVTNLEPAHSGTENVEFGSDDDLRTGENPTQQVDGQREQLGRTRRLREVTADRLSTTHE